MIMMMGNSPIAESLLTPWLLAYQKILFVTGSVLTAKATFGAAGKFPVTIEFHHLIAIPSWSRHHSGTM
jgi:hypothetical protein